MPIDLTDYAHTAADRGWGSGWPNCVAGSDLATVVSARSGTSLAVRKALAVLVDTLVDWTERPEGGNYRLKPEQCGGFNCRPIDNTSVASNHSWAIAVDLNWKDNPFSFDPQHTVTDLVATVWKWYGFAWGGNYHGKKDWMHFEFMGTPADAAERTQAALVDLAVGAVPELPLNLDSAGPAVAMLQARLNRDFPDFSHLVVDGDYGPKTAAAVREFQRRSGLAETGDADRITLEKLGLVSP
ncbi:peptidoglycan-binding protein [Nocardia sp. NPDC005746]|uniref:peptidoglycan-binding protein n=1 Tax=unclassified Nocardia TaxID=2637762 RepID=UPI003400E534